VRPAYETGFSLISSSSQAKQCSLLTELGVQLQLLPSKQGGLLTELGVQLQLFPSEAVRPALQTGFPPTPALPKRRQGGLLNGPQQYFISCQTEGFTKSEPGELQSLKNARVKATFAHSS